MSDAAKLAELEAILFEPVEEGYDKPTSYLPTPRYVIGQMVSVVIDKKDGHPAVESSVIISRVPSNGDPNYIGYGQLGIFSFKEEEIVKQLASMDSYTYRQGATS